MAVSLGSNISSLKAQRRLNDTSNSLSNSFERLSSGLRINRASDDAAGLAIASSLNAQARVFGQGIRNVNDAISLLNIAEGATQELSAILTRIKELATQSANGIYSDNQRTASNTEVQALRSEFVRITQTTKFNGVSLLDGQASSIGIQAGGNAPAGNQISVGVEGFNPDVAFQQSSISVVASLTDSSYIGDVNNDGNQDIVFTSVGSSIQVLLGNGDGTFSASLSSPFTDLYGGSLALEDYNSDGKLDVYFTYNPGRGRPLETDVYLNNGSGAFTFDSNNPALSVLQPDYDFNGDGISDTATLDGSSSQINLSISQSAIASFSVATRSKALATIGSAEKTLSDVITQRGIIGSQQSRLQTAANNLSQAKENFLGAESRIRDADVASEATSLIKNQILQQAGAAVLAQVNQAPSLVLSLLSPN